MLTRLTRPLRTALRWVRQSSAWPLWCRVFWHVPYSHKDAADFLDGRPTFCPRCKRRRFP
jgi:hypothetical protein